MKKPRVAIVVQRYGLEVSGGAELHARWLAERLLAIADVEVLTTCAIDYYTWADHYPAGITEINGVPVHRFGVDAPRDWKQAQKLTKHLLLNDHTLTEEIEWMKAQGPYSSDLFAAIERVSAEYDTFIFFTYLYASTYFGLPRVKDKAILVPTAHEDPFIQFEMFRTFFPLPRAIVYNTHTEQKMVNDLADLTAVEQIIAGVGINVPAAVDGARFRQKFGVSGDFLFYVGRIDESKNVPELITFFLEFLDQTQANLTLVLAGKSHIDLPQHHAIRPVGFISEQDKFDGMQAATVYMIPSKFESLSMVALESWLSKTPTLVNGNCAVLKDLTRLSNGGLYFHNSLEFQATLKKLLSSAELRSALGQNGHNFVVKNYNWDLILEKYARLL